MARNRGVLMSTYKENMISLLPYGKTSKRKSKRDGKGHIVVSYKKNKKKKTLKFDETAEVVL